MEVVLDLAVACVENPFEITCKAALVWTGAETGEKLSLYAWGRGLLLRCARSGFVLGICSGVSAIVLV